MEKVTKTEVVELVIETVISMSVGLVVGNVIKSTTPDNLGRLSKVGVSIGSWVLTNIAAEKGGAYAHETIEKIKAKFKPNTVEDQPIETPIEE